eukprot:Polyplicarium_translucidae@DN1750_c0_g1_i2.p1
MMCCHALSLLPSKQLKADSPHQQELIGSEMEKRMFRATEAFFEDILDSRGEQMTLVHLPPTDRRPVGLPFAYLEILKVFSFDHARQSMAVVAREVRNGGSSPEVVRGDVLVFVKGSFEKVSAMCVAGMPEDTTEVAESHARNGAYVLGMGWKQLRGEDGMPIAAERVAQYSRDEIEDGLRFEGLLLFRNEVKDESPKAMKQLRDGHIRSLMITGDCALTAGYVARACGMIRKSTCNAEQRLTRIPDLAERPIVLGEMVDGELHWRDLDTNETISPFEIYHNLAAYRELAVTQAAYDYLKVAVDRTGEKQQDLVDDDDASSQSTPMNSDAESTTSASSASSRKGSKTRKLLHRLLLRIRIFARMTPTGKIDVVQSLMARGFVVGMCGDGGNDCGALRAAHIGISMSDAEASVVSSFNAKEMNTTAVPTLIMEGRGTLASSLAAYKFLIIYSLIVSSVKVLLLARIANAMSEMQFMLIDCLICTLVANAMIRSAPRAELVSRRPTASLLGPSTVLSVVLMHAVNLIFLGMITYLMYNFANFKNAREWNQQFPSFAWWSRADNYEAATIFIWGATQLVNAGFLFSFGGEFRKNVFRNVMLTALCGSLQCVFLYLTVGGPSAFTCIFRTNCDNATSSSFKNGVLAVVSRVGEGLPFHGEGGDNIFPLKWKMVLSLLCLLNSLVNMAVDRLIINGPPAAYYRRVAEKELSQDKAALP